MAELVARSPCGGLLPLTIGELSVTEAPQRQMTLIAPFKGQRGAVSRQLEQSCGAGLPEPGFTTGAGDIRLVWFGRDQAMLVGAAPDAALSALAAITDQSDAWAVIRLAGPGADEVLARLVPVDLRPALFAQGQTLRAPLQHMSCSLTRLAGDVFEIMVFRSMAATLVHDLKTAMEAVAARR